MLTATDLANFVRCRHRLFLDRHGDPAERLPASDFLQLLWEGGRDHEETVIEGLDVVKVPRVPDPERRIASTLEVMAAEAPLIYHGLLRTSELIGEPDLLQRVEQPSRLGAWAYVPADIKCAGAFHDEKGTPKTPYLVQLSVYADLLEAAQGWRPTAGLIIDGEGVWQPYDLELHRAEYENLREEAMRVLDRAAATEPGWKGDCKDCPWNTHCWRQLSAADDVTTVADVGESNREVLRALGIRTGGELARAEPDFLRTGHGIGPKKSAAWPRQAAVQRRGEPLLLEPWTPPRVDFEISYDVEDYTPDSLVYLHGLLVRPSTVRRFGSPGFSPSDFGRYEAICARHPRTEAETWQEFLEWIARLGRRGSYAVLVYSHHERTTLGKLAERHGGSPDLDQFLGNVVDIHQIVKSHVVMPTPSRGLKYVARRVGFEWRDPDPGGAQSMVWWRDYKADPQANGALLDRILAYNEDDTRATFAVRDWLEAFAV